MPSISKVGALLPLILLACQGTLEQAEQVEEEPGGGDGTPPAESIPEGSISIDTSATNPFVSPTAEFHRVVGSVRAAEGISRLTVAGTPVATDGDGRFEVEVPVHRGLVLVDIEAEDGASPPHTRQAHRSLLSADFLPEGELNPTAAGLTLTDEILAAVAAPLESVVAEVNAADEIMSRRTLSEDDTCVTRPRSARHGTPTLSLRVTDSGELRAEILVPDLRVEFDGTCTVYIDVDVVGAFAADVVVETTLSAPPGRQCLRGLGHTPPDVQLRNFELEVDGDDLFDSIMVALFGEISEGETADRLRAAFAAEADAMLGPALEDLAVFESTETMELFGVPLTLELCATGLVSDGSSLGAQVGARVRGPGGLEAPGAPQIAGEQPPVGAGGFLLDANLLSQLLTSAWRAGGLSSRGVSEVELSTLAMLAPDLRDLYAEGTVVGVALEGQLPPLIHAATGGSGDLIFELGDLHMIFYVGSDTLFRVGTQLTLTVELEPAGGSVLRPVVIDVETVAWVLEEPVADINDEALAEAVALQIDSVAADLLGDAVISLPAVGTALIPTDVTPSEGGRYLHVALQ